MPNCVGHGSSPLARGLRPGQSRKRAPQWIIPARAGFTASSWFEGALLADHPRSRGVYLCRRFRPVAPVGSSPLARGLLHPHNFVQYVTGIIPARAGFTAGSSRRASARRDHPRSRGVYTVIANSNADIKGSSPLARGLQLAKAGVSTKDRIIPARAGFTSLRPALRPRSPDHPRSRGVYPIQWPTDVKICGSSPLARGLHSRRRLPRRPRRIIPARAGFTSKRSLTPRRRRDHPRSRGVY